jgi:hypothetical protein
MLYISKGSIQENAKLGEEKRTRKSEKLITNGASQAAIQVTRVKKKKAVSSSKD